MTQELRIVQPRIKRRPARFRGPLSSEEYNDIQDEVFSDIIALSTAVNTNNNLLVNSLNQIYQELQNIRGRTSQLEEKDGYREFVYGSHAVNIDKYLDFHDATPINFPATVPADKAASYKSQFGEIALPINAVENKFYNFSLRTSEIIIPSDFSAEANGIFDKADGNGTQDYESGGLVNEGEVKNAFNGINETVWSRTVTFPLESDVDEVEVQLTAVVPAGISSQANLLEVVPYPEGNVDITSLSTAGDLGESFLMVDNFGELNNAVAKRFHFSPRNVEQVRIRLRSRNWQEVNGKKVFTYGLREMGLKLVDYKKEFIDSDGFGQNPTVVVQISPPSNHSFNTLFRVDPVPNFLLEDVSKRHVRLRLSSTPDLSGTIWDSAVDIPPQLGVGTGIDLGGVSNLYGIYTLRFVENSGGFQSPFPVGTTPTVNGLGLLFKAIPN